MEIILLVGVGVLLVFFMLNSRKRQKTQQEKLATGLIPGAQVMTSFGLFGEVVEVDPDGLKVTLESTPGTRVVVHKQAIAQIEPPQSAESEDSETALDANSDVDVRGTEDRYTDDANYTSDPKAYETDASAYTSGSAKSESEGAENTSKPRITDAELDAMNEAKRKQKDSDSEN